MQDIRCSAKSSFYPKITDHFREMNKYFEEAARPACLMGFLPIAVKLSFFHCCNQLQTSRNIMQSVSGIDNVY